MKEKAEKLVVLFSELIENSYRDQKSACIDTPLCSLSSNDLKVLCSLNGKNHPSIKEISDELAIPMSTLTGIFNKLVTKNLVARDRCEEDRRVVRVHLTAFGREAAAIKKSNSHNFALEILQKLSNKEQDQLLLLLTKIVSE